MGFRIERFKLTPKAECFRQTPGCIKLKAIIRPIGVFAKYDILAGIRVSIHN